MVVKDQEKEIWSAEFGGGSTSENPVFVFDSPKIKGNLQVYAIQNNIVVNYSQPKLLGEKIKDYQRELKKKYQFSY